MNSAKPGSLLAQARPVSEAVDEYLSVLCYGRNRVGKTTWACQFDKPLLLISLEPAGTGGAQSVAKTKGIDWLRLDSTESVRQVIAELDGGSKYKTVVIDGVTSLEKIVLQEIMRWDEPAEMLRVGNSSPVGTAEYTERGERIRKLLRPFLKLKGCNRIMLGNQKDHNPPESRKSVLAKRMMSLLEESYWSVETGGGTANWLADSCDYIVQLFEDMEVVKKEITVLEGQPPQIIEEATGRRVRRLRLGTHTNYAAGQRVDQFGGGKELPEFIDGKTPMELYKNFREAIK